MNHISIKLRLDVKLLSQKYCQLNKSDGPSKTVYNLN